MKKKVSIIVPIYNVEKYLKRCIDSILKQTYKELEIILVDDGSTDSSGLICEEYKENENRIKVIHKNNGGLSSARNAGLDIATGAYLTFIDSDDWIAENHIEQIMNALEAKSADIAVCGIVVIDGKTSNVYKSVDNICEFTSYDAIDNILMGGSIDVSACNKVYKNEVFNNVRYPEGENNEDAAVIIDILSKVKKIVQIPDNSYYYYQRKGSISKTPILKDYYNQMKHAEDIYQKCIRISMLFSEKAKYYVFNQILSILKLMIKRKQVFEYKRDYISFIIKMNEYETKHFKAQLSIKRKLLYRIIKIFGLFCLITRDNT